MKRRYKFLLIFLFIVILTVSGVVYFANRAEKELAIMQAEVLESIDLTSTDDGTYEGTYSAFPITVVVNVTVENHLITQIEIIKHLNGQGGPAEVIIEDVISTQSLDVDLIAGSSYSSRVILLAIQDAIK